MVAEKLKERFVIVNFPSHEENGKTIYHHLACSGATVKQPDGVALGDDYHWFQNQVDYVIANLSNRPTLVSITVGANDYGWGNIPQFLSRLKWNMEDDTKFIAWVDKLIDTPETGVEALLQEQIEKLLSHPNVSIVITEVHNPINPKSSLFAGTNLASACGWNAQACFIRTQYAVTKLNGAIVGIMVDEAQFDRLQVAAIQNQFVGHESPPPCGLQPISSTYIQYPGDGHSNSISLLPGWLRRALGRDVGGDCFHPNLEGAKIFADSVNEDAIRVGR